MIRRLAVAALFALSSAVDAPAAAYSAAGDRIFVSGILLPQIAPSDEVYARASTLPLARRAAPGASDRGSNVSGVYDKAITERLGVRVEGGYNRLDGGDSTRFGWQNLELGVQYLAILDPANEFLVSVGVNREFGIGAQRIGASEFGATTPTIYFGKGLGELGPEELRPFSIRGFAGYQLSDAAPRPDQIVGGLAIAYSLPYFESKVRALRLPDFLLNVTPQIELIAATPTRAVQGATTTATAGPGFVYTGEGWELGVEALIPLTRATGEGVGFIAQIHFSLDFFFPEGIGAPLFRGR